MPAILDTLTPEEFGALRDRQLGYLDRLRATMNPAAPAVALPPPPAPSPINPTPGIVVGEVPPYSPYNAEAEAAMRERAAFEARARAAAGTPNAGASPRPSMFRVPQTFGEFFSPGTKAAANATAEGVGRAIRALPAAVGTVGKGVGVAALPVAEVLRERNVLFGDQYDLGDKAAAVGRMAVRGVPATIGGIVGGIGGGRVAGRPGAIGGSVAGSVAGYKIGDAILNAFDSNTPGEAQGETNPTVALPSAPPSTAQDSFGVLADQQNPPFKPFEIPTFQFGQPAPSAAPQPAGLPARQSAPGSSDRMAERPALVGASVAQSPVPANYDTGDLFSPEAKAQIDKLTSRNDELSNLSKQYFKAQGMREPRGLTGSDKLQILAKGLGTAALIAAFPGAGLLLALGGGLVGGAEEADSRRTANAAADQQYFTNASTVFGQQSKVLQEQIKNDQEMLGLTNEAYNSRFNRNRQMAQDAMEQRKFDEEARRFGLNYAQRERQIRQQAAAARNTGLVPIVGADGKTRLMRPTEGMEVPAGYGVRGALSGGARPPNFNPLPSVDSVAKELMMSAPSGAMTYAQARAQARQMINDELRGFGYATSGALPAAAPGISDTVDEDIRSELGR